MARRRIGGDDEDGDYAAYLASRQPREDLLGRALQLLQYQRQEQQSAEDRAFKERQAQAEEMYRQGQLDISRRGETRLEESAKDTREREKTADIQAQMNRGEDVAYRTRQEQFALDKEAAAKVEKEQAQQQKIFEAAVDKGLIKPGDPEWEEWIKDLDPQAAERLTRVEGLKKETAYKKGSEAYAQMTPKARKQLEAGGKGAAPYLTELGGPEIYKRILAEAQQQAAPKPNLTPGTASPVGEGRLPLGTFMEQNAPTAPPSDIFSEAGVRIGLPLVDARDYGKFPGSVEDLIRASNGQPLPESLFAQPKSALPPEMSSGPEIGSPILGGVPVPQGASILDQMLQKIRGRGGVGSPLPPIPPQGVFQPFPG